MLQSYKLRLGDGTVLAVDHDGLSSWLGDRKALVQPVGSNLWKPLKGFLAQERSAARRAARQQPKPPSTPRAALPLVYPGAKVPAEPHPGSRGGADELIPVPTDGLPLLPPSPEPRDDPDRSRRRRRVPASPATLVRPSLPRTPPAPVLAKQPAGPRRGETKPTADSGLPGVSSPPLIPPPPIIAPPPAPSAKLRDDRDTVPRRPAHPVPRAPLEPPAEPAVGTESVLPLLPSDEDVGWMTLPKPLEDEPPALPAVSWRDPLEPSSVSARPSLLQGALLWLMSQAGSAYRALLSLWKSLARGDRPLPSFSPGEPAPWRAVDSERSASPEPRPSVEVPLGVRARAEKGREWLGVYRPRRSTDDGLPILQLERLDDEERSSDDAPEIILEPLDD